MKVIGIALIFLSMVVIISCSATKQVTVLKSKDGIYSPGDEEAKEIRKQYKDVTVSQLKEGYNIYIAGACVNCHRPYNIYNIADNGWKTTLDDMAQRARISDAQKDAVFKYVLAIKSVQPK